MNSPLQETKKVRSLLKPEKILDEVDTKIKLEHPEAPTNSAYLVYSVLKPKAGYQHIINSVSCDPKDLNQLPIQIMSLINHCSTNIIGKKDPKALLLALNGAFRALQLLDPASREFNDRCGILENLFGNMYEFSMGRSEGTELPRWAKTYIKPFKLEAQNVEQKNYSPRKVEKGVLVLV